MNEELACDVNELRTLFLFEKLSDEQLGWLCREGHVESVEAGWLYREGEPAEFLYVLLEGSVALSRRVGQEDVEFSRSDQRGVYGGAFQAYLGNRIPQVYNNSLRVTKASRFYVLAADKFAQLMSDWFPMALHLLEGLFFGMTNSRLIVEQRERLLALGSLSAGLTHELNNPAAAAVRATSSLRGRQNGMRHELATIAFGSDDLSTLKSLIRLEDFAVEALASAPNLTPIEASDLEDRLGEWLVSHRIADGWELAPVFVQAGLDEKYLDKVATVVGDADLEGAIRWLSSAIDTALLLDEIQDSTTRISTLIAAAKQYSQMDRAPYQFVDVHELLDSTLLMLNPKIGPVTVVREYDRSLPSIPAYAAELNQVWTNLIDNAIGAMSGSGRLTVRTSRDDDRLLVEIGDTGPGVPEDIRSRIFEPFFTTKPFGEGTGLGLDISWRIVVNRHHGDLRFESKPGDTRFQVRLPFDEPEVPDGTL